MILFSVITPSWNNLPYLQRCVHSVADQTGLEGGVEHIVIDGGSSDGTVEWLTGQHKAQHWISEPDHGMYDAINKGLDRSQGELIAYLNCDEQYLPGTLALIARHFGEHPECDIVFADALLVGPNGSYLASRRGYLPRWYFMGVSQLYVLSCTMFFRRRILDQGFRFDPRWKAAGDLDFVLKILRAGYRAHHIRHYTSTFTMTGENLGGSNMAVAELMQIRQTMPRWIRALRLPLNLTRLLIKLALGGYGSDRGRVYAAYSSADSTARTTFTIAQTRHGWPAS